MKRKPSPSIKLSKALTRVLQTARKLSRDAERDYLNGRSLPTGFIGRHTRQYAKIARMLNIAVKHANTIGDMAIIEAVDCICNLASNIVYHSQYSRFFDNDYDPREWQGWSVLADMRAKIIEVRKLLKVRK